MSDDRAAPPSRRTRPPARKLPAATPAPAPVVSRPAFSPRQWILPVLVLGVAGWIAVQFFNGPDTPSGKQPSPVKVVTIQAPRTPPPPPPPPPPPKIVQQEQKMIAQEPVQEEEPAPAEPKPADDSPPDIGTGIKGDGPDGFGLSSQGGNGRQGTGLAGSGAARSRWGWYAAKVQAGISEALRRDPQLRDAVLNGKVRIWPDATGRITRAKIDSSTGDTALDAAVTKALNGVQLAEPPPADMPLPILLRVTARRP